MTATPAATVGTALSTHEQVEAVPNGTVVQATHPMWGTTVVASRSQDGFGDAHWETTGRTYKLTTDELRALVAGAPFTVLSAPDTQGGTLVHLNEDEVDLINDALTALHAAKSLQRQANGRPTEVHPYRQAITDLCRTHGFAAVEDSNYRP